MERASLALRNPLQCPTAWNVMGLRLLTPFLNSSFFSSSWCEAVSFELCSFNKAAMPQGFKLSKETFPEQNCNEQLGSDFVFPRSVSKEAALGRNQLWSSAFTLLLTWMWLLPWPSFPWSASAHPAASVSDLSGLSTLPAGLLCGIGAIIQKGAVTPEWEVKALAQLLVGWMNDSNCLCCSGHCQQS